MTLTNTMSHIYLIQDGFDIGTDVYKIGRTEQGSCSNNISKLKRVESYNTGTVQHNTWIISPSNQLNLIEHNIKDYFNKKYKLVKGREWFEGDVRQMKKDIDFIIDNHINNSSNVIKENQSNKPLHEWTNNIEKQSYEPINEILKQILKTDEDYHIFFEYMISILDNKPNRYGVLLIPGHESGEILLDILRNIGFNYYNRYSNPRNTKERLIRHDCDNSIEMIKANKNCHHVYLWSKDLTKMKSIYEKNYIRYTVCNINVVDLMRIYQDCKNKYNLNINYAILGMLNDYLNRRRFQLGRQRRPIEDLSVSTLTD